MRRFFFAASVCFFILQAFPLFLHSESEHSIQIKGSDTMVNLGQAWAEAFMKKHPEALIAVTGGGSGTGIAALISGTCDIAQSSREISGKEKELAEANGRSVKGVVTALDAVVMVVHPENPIDTLTIDQLSDVFTGRITNWKELGGKDEQILVLSRERNSGTHVYVLEEVVRKGRKEGTEEFAPQVLMMPSSQAIEQEAAENPSTIGYFGLGYLSPHVKALKIFSKKTGSAAAPSIETVVTGDYPLSRPLNFYLPGEPRGIVQTFIEFVLSEEGQVIVREMDFVPLPKHQPAES